MLQAKKSAEEATTETPVVARAEIGTPHVLNEVTPQQQNVTLEELAIYVEAAVNRNKARGKTVYWIDRYYVMGWNLLFTITCTVLTASHRIGLPVLKLLILALLISLLSSFLKQRIVKVAYARWVRNYWPTERAAIRRLLAMDDVRTVPSLIDSLEWTEDSTLQPELRQALGRLLPRLTETEAQELGEERQGILAGWMREWHNPIVGADNTLLLGIMHVMACLGRKSLKMRDYRCEDSTLALLPLFKRWASGKNAGKDPAIRQAAIECCDAIEQKLDPARTGEQLLRASEPPTAGSESLLRPAQGTQPTPSQELLRPGNSE